MNNEYLRRVNFNNRAKRVPICFCIDISLSMDEIIEGEQYCKITNQTIFGDQRQYRIMEPIIPNDSRVKTKADKVAEGLGNFYEAVKDDDMACDSCEAAIVTFRDTPRVFEGFDSIENKNVPIFPKPAGNTNITQAIEMSLDILEKQKELYKNNRIPYFQPWLVIFTDGQPTDDVTKIKQKLIRLQNEQKLSVYVMSLSDKAEVIDSLRGFSLSDPILSENPKVIKQFFNFLAKSVSVTASSGEIPSVISGGKIPPNFF